MLQESWNRSSKASIEMWTNRLWRLKKLFLHILKGYLVKTHVHLDGRVRGLRREKCRTMYLEKNNPVYSTAIFFTQFLWIHICNYRSIFTSESLYCLSIDALQIH